MAQPTDEQRKTTGDEPVAAERPRRHSIHSTSPTSTDQLPLPEVEPIIGAPADPEPRDSDPHRTDRPLESFDSLYEAISTVPMDHMTYPAELYYPIGGPSNPPGGAPPFAGQWGSPPPATPFGQGMQEYASAESVGRGERRTGRCKFFNALKGFGFILDHRGEELGPDVEVFVHYSAIQAVQGNRGGFKSLSENEEVEYTITQGAKGWQAQDVTGPNGAPVIGSPSNGPKPPSQSAYDRKFSVGSFGSDDSRLNSYYLQRGRGSIGGTDSGYYSSAMTSPVHTPHQLYSPPQYPAYPHPSPHMSYGPPPMGMPLGLHHGNGYAFLPAPPPHLANGASPPTIPLPLGDDPIQNGHLERGPSPYRPLPPSAFYQPGPPPFRQGPPPPMYFGSPPEGYYMPPQVYGFSPPYPPPLPLPTGVGAIAGYSEGTSSEQPSPGERSPDEMLPQKVQLEKAEATEKVEKVIAEGEAVAA